MIVFFSQMQDFPSFPSLFFSGKKGFLIYIERRRKAPSAQLRAGGSHGGDDHDHSYESCQGVEESNASGGGGDLNVLVQVGTVDNGAVTGNGQGEECLAESVDPNLPVQQTGGVQSEDVLIAVDGAGQESNVNCQNQEQAEQSRDHDLAGLLDAAGNTQAHDDNGNNDGNHDPNAVADAEICQAVLTEQIFAQTKDWPQRILLRIFKVNPDVWVKIRPFKTDAGSTSVGLDTPVAVSFLTLSGQYYALEKITW